MTFSNLNSSDLVVRLMRDNYEAVGFIPESSVLDAQYEKRLYHQIDNGEWVGYLLSGPIRSFYLAHVWQECIDKSARRYGSGRVLFETYLSDCIRARSRGIALRCAEGLESNLFWQSLGFELVGVDLTPNRRNRKVFMYVYTINPKLPHYRKMETFRSKYENVIWVNSSNRDDLLLKTKAIR